MDVVITMSIYGFKRVRQIHETEVHQRLLAMLTKGKLIVHSQQTSEYLRGSKKIENNYSMACVLGCEDICDISNLLTFIIIKHFVRDGNLLWKVNGI